MDRGATVRLPSGNGRRSVCGSSARDGAVAAAVQLQRDVGLMQTNLDVLDQYSLALQGTACGCGCGDGAVAAFDGSVAAPLVDFCVWTDFHVTCIIFVYCCVLLLASFSLVTSLRRVLSVK